LRAVIQTPNLVATRVVVPELTRKDHAGTRGDWRDAPLLERDQRIDAGIDVIRELEAGNDADRRHASGALRRQGRQRDER